MKYENIPGTRIPSLIPRAECLSSGYSINEELMPKVMNGEPQQTSPAFTYRIERCVEKDKLSSSIGCLLMIIVDILALAFTLVCLICTVFSIKALSDISGAFGVLIMVLLEAGALILLVWSMKMGKEDDKKIKESIDSGSFSIMKYKITDLNWYDSNFDSDTLTLYLKTKDFYISVSKRRYCSSCIREDIYAAIIFCENKSFFYLLES